MHIKLYLLGAIFIVSSMLVSTLSSNVAEQVGVVAPLWLSKFEPATPVSGRLLDLLNRVGPNMRASSDYFDFNDIHLNESIEAWNILQEQSKRYAQSQVDYYKPKIEQLVKEANVSVDCQLALDSTLNLMRQLDSRAVKMWSATGNFPPVGMFDGQLNDLGSYRGCVDMLPSPASSASSLARTSYTLEYTSYCTIPMRPVVPKRVPFHMTFHQISGLVRSMSKYGVMGELATKAQYFYIMYVKTGVCVPYQCSPVDIQQVTRLVARRLGMMAGPVKCFTKAPQHKIRSHHDSELIFGSIENKPILVETTAPLNFEQIMAATLIGSFYAMVTLSTLWHWVCLVLLERSKRRNDGCDNELEVDEMEKRPIERIEYSGFKHVAIDYFSLITNGREFLKTSMRSNEIKCLHGLRVVTMLWIILVHTLQYNDWSGFTRVFENVRTLQNPILHPLYNANYVVDNFFFMSGLLAAYKTWFDNKGTTYKFSIISSLIGRYLRLTPQVLLISLLYILLPLAGDSPFWYDMSQHASKYCQRNWWINLLHLQSFYKEDEICNLVGWWISIDMFYYVVSLVLICMILNKKTRLALTSTCLFVGFCVVCAAYRHFTGGYTPNNLGTVPQVAEVWTRYVVNFFWSPYTHAYPFFLGLWVGYILANNKWRPQVRRWSSLGWFLALSSMLIVNLSSHIWMSGKVEIGSQYISTAYNILCALIWSTGFAWVVIACHYGCAPTLDKLLSIEPFILLSKASFIIYLSHMLIIRLYFGLQNSLLEVSVFTLTFSFIGITVLATIFGIFLCISFEGPSLKLQRLYRGLTQKSKQHDWTNQIPNNHSYNDQKIALGLNPTSNTLLK